MSPIRIRGAHWPRGCSGRRPLAGSPRPGLPLAAPRVPARDWPCPGGSRPDSARPRGAERRFQHRGRRTAIGTGTGPGAGPGTGSGDRTGTWRGSRDRDREQGPGVGTREREQGAGTGDQDPRLAPSPRCRARQHRGPHVAGRPLRPPVCPPCAPRGGGHGERTGRAGAAASQPVPGQAAGETATRPAWMAGGRGGVKGVCAPVRLPQEGRCTNSCEPPRVPPAPPVMGYERREEPPQPQVP